MNRPTGRSIARIGLAFLCMGILGGLSTATDTQTTKSGRWIHYPYPEAAGWSSGKLEEARQYFEAIEAASVFVVYKGKVLSAWGDVAVTYGTHSVRKSFMSAMIGIHAAEGGIDLQKTMLELSIDDIPTLSDQEKTARVIHLVKARSGVYHTAAYESAAMHDYKPPRGSHPPGTFWCYNNWDFNTLVTIFNQETLKDFFEELENRIAVPLGMQDFLLSETVYYYQLDRSIHPAYPFRISARDSARFGLLYLQNGRWGEKQVIPAAWVRRSTRAWSNSGDYIPGTGYGYMWWTFRPGSVPLAGLESLGEFKFYAALGTGVQAILVIPGADMVFVHRVNTDGDNFVSLSQILHLADSVLAAKEFETIDLVNLRTRCNRLSAGPGEPVTLSSKIKNSDRDHSAAGEVTFWLSKNRKWNATDLLLGTAPLPSIAPGKKKVIRLKMELPADLRQGAYYLISYADKENLNFDPWTADNISVGVKKLMVGANGHK